jgi:RNA polymerase sigma-70 factor (ECF subfamily)
MAEKRGSRSGRSSDRKAYGLFLTLFSQHHRQIHAYLYGLLHNHHDADDVFQRTSLVLWEKFGEFQPGTNFVAWACRVAFFQVCNFLRTASRDRLRFSDDLLNLMADERARHAGADDQRAEALTECIGRLSGRHRDLVRKAYDRDRPIRDLAGEMGQAVQTVYNQLNRIRQVLYDCVEQRLSRGEA